MKNLNPVEQQKKNVRIFVTCGLAVCVLLVGGYIMLFGNASKQPNVPYDVETSEFKPIDDSDTDIPTEVIVKPIAVPSPTPKVDLSHGDGGTPVTAAINEDDENIADSPEQAAEEMVKAVEDALIDKGIDIVSASDEEVEKAVEAVNKDKSNNTGNNSNSNSNSSNNNNSGSNDNTNSSGSNSNNTDGNRKFVDGKEYIKNPFTGEWMEKQPGAVAGTMPSGNGVVVGY